MKSSSEEETEISGKIIRMENLWKRNQEYNLSLHVFRVMLIKSS